MKILDFGLAKLIEVEPTGDDASTCTVEETTEKGTILGTVTYMPLVLKRDSGWLNGNKPANVNNLTIQ